MIEWILIVGPAVRRRTRGTWADREVGSGVETVVRGNVTGRRASRESRGLGDEFDNSSCSPAATLDELLLPAGGVTIFDFGSGSTRSRSDGVSGGQRRDHRGCRDSFQPRLIRGNHVAPGATTARRRRIFHRTLGHNARCTTIRRGSAG